jgi:hypothetical protein
VSVKIANPGHFAIPTAPAAGTSCTSGAANVFTTTYVQLIASTAAALYITGFFVESATALGGTYDVVQLATGAAASEVIVGQYLVALSTGTTIATGYRPIFPPIPVAISTRIACKTADSVGAKATLITLECIAQSTVVDDAIPVTTVTTVTNQLTAAAIATAHWQDATAGDFTVAGSVGKSVMNGVALGTGLTINGYTGNTPQTGDAFAVIKSGGTGDNAAIKAKTDNLPAAPASTTNITAGTITTATNLTNAPAAGDFTAAMKTSLNAATPVATVSGDFSATMKTSLNAATPVASLSGDFTAAMKTSLNASTPASVTGAVGSVVGLAASNLDATISSRSTYAGGAVASVTGAVGSVTGLTASDVGAIKAKTDNLPASPSAVSDIPTAATNAAAVLTAAGVTPIASEIKKVNGVAVTGTGAPGTPWGP